MTTYAPIKPDADFFIGEAFTIGYRTFTGATAELASPALAGATTLVVRPLPQALLSGAKLLFAEGFMVKLSSGASVGATSLSVAATAAALAVNSVGREAKDVSALTLRWILELPQSTLALATLTPSLEDDPADPDGSPIQLAVVNVSGSDTTGLSEGAYLGRLRDTVNNKTLAQGDVALKVR